MEKNRKFSVWNKSGENTTWKKEGISKGLSYSDKGVLYGNRQIASTLS